MRTIMLLVLVVAAIFLGGCTSPEQMKEDAKTVADAAAHGIEVLSAPLQRQADKAADFAADQIEAAKEAADKTATDFSLATQPGAIGEGNFDSGNVSLRLTVYNSKNLPIIYQYVAGDQGAIAITTEWIIAEETEEYVVYTTTFHIEDDVENLFFGSQQYTHFAGTFLSNPDGSLANGFAPDEDNVGWRRIK